MKKIAIALAAVLAAVCGAGYAIVSTKQPKSVPAPSIQVAMTAERVARGKYLYHLADCDGCHSQRDFTRFAGPVVDGGKGSGVEFPKEMGLPGRIIASNITPDRETGLGQWTDGERIRAIRDGIGRDGRALFPMMPYGNYRRMSDEDVEALVAYLNTLPAVRNPLPQSTVDFPVSFFIKEAPQPSGKVPPPQRSDKLKYGEYLTAVAGCAVCHTSTEKGQPVESKRLGGGEPFRMPGGIVVSANISPDPETGIGRWSEQQFLDKFYEYKAYAEKGPPQVGPESLTLMPWLNLSQLPPEDLGAIFVYLKAQKPVRNAVETHPGH